MSIAPARPEGLAPAAEHRSVGQPPVIMPRLGQSYMEIEVRGSGLFIYERMGDGSTAPLVRELQALGLSLDVLVSSPCG